MILYTTIKRNSSGVVIAEFGDVKYEFNGDEMSCDVSDESHAAHLISTGNFSTELVENVQTVSSVDGVIGIPQEDDGDDDDDDDEHHQESSMPIEALTPIVKIRKPRKVK